MTRSRGEVWTDICPHLIALFPGTTFNRDDVLKTLDKVYQTDLAGYCYIFPKEKGEDLWIKLGMTDADRPPDRIQAWKSKCFTGNAAILGSSYCPTTWEEEPGVLYRIPNIKRFEGEFL